MASDTITLPATILQARIHGPRDIRIDEVPLAAPGPREVVVQCRRATIAGTDLKFFEGILRPDAYPQGIGASALGVIAAVGDGVTRVAVGDLVMAHGPGGCGECPRCQRGETAWCFRRTEPMQRRGACFAQYTVLHEAQVSPLPNGLSDDQAVLLAPISLAQFVEARFRYRLGDRIVVVGGGKVGSGQIAYAVSRGARVAALEPRPERRAIAQRLGAELTLDPGQADSLEQVRAWTDGIVEYVVDAVCTVEAQQMAFDLVAPGGAIAVLGTAPWAVPVQWIVHRSLRVYGCRGGGTVRDAAGTVLSGAVDLTYTINHRVGLQELPAAYKLLASGTSDAFVTVIDLEL